MFGNNKAVPKTATPIAIGEEVKYFQSYFSHVIIHVAPSAQVGTERLPQAVETISASMRMPCERT